MAVKSSNVMARVEPDVKQKAEAIMNSLGLPVSVVINALYQQIIYTNGIPFSITLPKKVPSLENMTEEEFDNMLSTSLEQAKKGEGKPIDVAFDSIIEEIK